jgi:transcriptional regulator
VLIRRHDAAFDDTQWRDFVVTHPFGHLVAGGRDRRVPVVAPTQFVVRDDELLVHFARENPIWAAIAENPAVVLSVAGDWSFIPSAWKALPGEDPLLGIPTTYYAAVQLMGDARVVDDADELAALLRELLGVFQAGTAVADPFVAHQSRLRTIRGLVVSIDAVKAKFKYGGNVDEAHRLAVAEQLAARGGPGDDAARRHLLAGLDRDRRARPASTPE